MQSVMGLRRKVSFRLCVKENGNGLARWMGNYIDPHQAQLQINGFWAVVEASRADECEGWISGIDETALGVEGI